MVEGKNREQNDVDRGIPKHGVIAFTGNTEFDAVEIDQIAERPHKGRSTEPGERARHGTIIDGVLHEYLKRLFTRVLNPEVPRRCQKKVLP